jgi:hypothetical protein
MSGTNCAHEAMEWNDCDKPGHEVECYIATCESCGLKSYDCCAHEVIRWRHSMVELECQECNAGGGDPCSQIVCAACGDQVEPTTDAHHRQLVEGA